MENEKLIDLIDEFKCGLIAQATDGSIDDEEYKNFRAELLYAPQLKDKIPRFIKSNRTPMDFRRDLQGQFDHYAQRRALITSEMNNLVEFLESDITDSFSSIQEYEKLDYIGNGGFGAVYKYRNLFLDKLFAVKIYAPVFATSEEQIEGEKRFFREAKMLFDLNHPNIVRIYDAGKLKNGEAFIRMELIEGYNLNKVQERYGNLSFEQSKKVLLPILRGLNYAHEKGIIHRDLKPSNIMYSTVEKRFVIIDFGVSAFLDTDIHTKLTKTGERVAGGNFIDPLLQENPKLRDVRSDIYSIGAIWYFLLCGKAPSGSDMKNYLFQANQKLNENEIEFIMKCLASNIEVRYSDCRQLIDLIETI